MDSLRNYFPGDLPSRGRIRGRCDSSRKSYDGDDRRCVRDNLDRSSGDDPVGWNVRKSSSCGRGVVRWKDLLEQVDARAPREYDHEGSYWKRRSLEVSP